MLKPLKLGDWIEPAAYLPICTLPFTPRDLHRAHALDFEEFDDDGLGPGLCCVFKAGETQFRLESHRLGPPGSELCTAFVHGDEPDALRALHILLAALTLSEHQLHWRAEGLGPARWALYRLDDHHNEVEMRRYQQEASALWMARQYEAKGHKQLYFVRLLP